MYLVIIMPKIRIRLDKSYSTIEYLLDDCKGRKVRLSSLWIRDVIHVFERALCCV